MLTAIKDPVLEMLGEQIREVGTESAVVFLGDNIYPNGMPDQNDKMRKRAEARIKVQLDVVKNHAGKVYFLSGNHDWNKGRPGGYEYMLREEEYIKSYSGRQE